MDRPPTPNRVYFDQTLSNALRFIDECVEPRTDDPSVICIKCLLDSFPLDREFNARAFQAELEPLLDDDLKRFLPGKDSTTFDEDTFAQLAMAQLGREANKLVLTGSKDRYPTYDPRSALTRILAGEARRDPCVDATLPTPLNLLSQSSSQSNVQSLWAPGQTPFGDVAFRSDTYAALAELTGTESFAFRLSNHTALTRTLSGADLLATTRTDPSQDQAARTDEFFRKHSAAFTGRQDGAFRVKGIAGRVVRVQQVSDDGIPVYGGVMIASYDQRNNLTFVNNSCYPLPSGTFGDHFRGCKKDAFTFAIGHIADVLRRDPAADAITRRLADMPHAKPDLHAFLDTDFDEPDECFAGRVVLPVLILDEQIYTTETIAQDRIAEAKPDYRAAWAVHVVDHATSRSWRVFLGGRLEDDEHPILVVIEDMAGASVPGFAFRTVADILANQGATMENIAVSDTDQFADAKNFELDQPGAGSPLADLRVTNAFFHLKIARERFEQIVSRAWPTAVPPSLPGSAARVKVRIDPDEGEAKYSKFIVGNHVFDHLTLPKGKPNRAVLPYSDTALDPEVIYHEFTHAVLSGIQPDFREPGNSLFRVSLDEGLAFYFACSLSDQLLRELAPGLAPLVTQPYRWGKVSRSHRTWTDHAYRDLERWESNSVQPARQRPDHDYLTTYGIFPTFASVPIDEPVDPDSPANGPQWSGAYAVGVLWARTLWDIRQVLGAEWADAIILRAMHLAGGVQSDLETPAEALIHVDRELAEETLTPSHENALRLIFASRGIFADSPIRTILQVQTGHGAALLAATESPIAGDAACGCLISLNSGVTWQSLGQNGPRDVVALTWLPTGPNKETASIWAATEVWIHDPAGPPQPQIFRYDLHFDNAGLPTNLAAAWAQVTPVLRTNAGILSLAATYANPANTNGPVWLFVGAEDGIYKFDGAKWPTTIPNTMLVIPNVYSESKDLATFDLRIVTRNGKRHLLAATATTVDRYVINDIQPSAANDASALTRQARQANASLAVSSDANIVGEEASVAWVGTVDQGLTLCDLTAGNPTFVSMGGTWQGLNHPPAVYAIARNAAAGQFTLLAGTSRGLFGRNGNGDWEKIDFNAPELANTSILALCPSGNQWLMGTAQRGLWQTSLQQPITATRITNGVARLMASESPPATNCNGFAGTTLPAHGIRTHVITVTSLPQGGLVLEVQVRANDMLRRVEVFYASIGIDLAAQRIAGVRSLGIVPRSANASHRFQSPAAGEPGYYVVVVEAGNADACYSLSTNL